jgi:uncharacterized membrane protein YagU involved in acid resistance
MSRTLSLPLLVAGFLAGAIATVIFHQLTVLVLHLANFIPNFPWSMRPVPPLNIPTIVNQMFWGGLWGVLFAAILPWIPARELWQKGAIFGLVGVWLLGNGILVPLFKGTPLLFGFQLSRAWLGFVILLVFGIGLGLIYGLLASRMAGSRVRV